jgi:hypothetical protein
VTEQQTADSRIRGLERRASDIQKAGLLTEARDAVEDIDATLSTLPTRLQEARTRGYVFRSYLEVQIDALGTQWQTMRGDVQREIERRARDLEGDLRQVEPAVSRLQPYLGRSLSSAQPTIAAVESQLSSVERRAEAALGAVRGMFDSLRSQVQETRSHVDECMAMLDLIDQASFGFQPGEAGVAAVRAKWLQDARKEGPKGILFLTDRRLAFERREKVATKKVLFITTASEDVKELLWEAPIGALTEARASEMRQALVLKKEQLTLTFKHPSRVREVLLQLESDSEAWGALINRVVSGDIEHERVGGTAPVLPQQPEGIVPSRCPSCGANLDVTTIKGMTAVKCAYCGTSVPLTGVRGTG